MRIALKVVTRFLQSIVIEEWDDCWLWGMYVDPGGYGRMGIKGLSPALVHRVSYELFVGPIPEGLHIDHLCGTRKCVNPAHLEAVTQRENNRRANHNWEMRIRPRVASE